MINTYIFWSTFKDMLRPGRIAVWVLIAVVLGLVALLWKEMSREPVGLSEYGMLVRLIVYRIVALAAAMFTIAVISQEVEQKTIVYLVTRTSPRNSIIVSRGLAAVAAVTLMSWFSLVSVALVMLGAGFVGQSVFWTDMLAMMLGALAYSALFIFITLIMNRAMLVILIFTFMWEAFVPFLKGDMYLLTINTYMTAIATHPGKGSVMSALQSETATISPLLAWGVLLTIGIGVLVLGGWWFSRFQYLPREDAE